MLTEYTWQVPMSCGLGIARWRLPVAVLVRAACSSSTQSSTSDRRSTSIFWMLGVSCGVWAHDVPPRFFSRVYWMWHLTFVWDTLVKQQLSATPMQSAGVTTILHTTPRGFEPLRAEPNGFRVHPLNRSGTVSADKNHFFVSSHRILIDLHGCSVVWLGSAWHGSGNL